MNTARVPRETPAEERYTGAGHPPVGTLRAYQKGLLSAEERERIQDHFVFCWECSETMLDLDAFFGAAPTPGRQDPEKLVEAWNELVQSLAPKEP